MPVEFRPIQPKELDSIRHFLLRVFGVSEDALFVQPDLVQWKYFASHPLWPGTRSYIITKDDELAAHGCVSPFQLVTTEGHRMAAIQIIDWASGGQMPGAGLLLYRNCLPLTDTLVTVGGSEETRKLISMVKWFRPLPPLKLYARPLHPFRQIRASRSTIARDLGRLARNWNWSLWPPLPKKGEWIAKSVDRFDRTQQPTGTFTALYRDPAWLNYLLECPAAAMTGLELYERDIWRGHVLLSRTGAQIRIADLSIDSDQACDWQRAVAAVLHYVRRMPNVFEIAAASTLPLLCAAFEACGFRPRGTSPIYLADPRQMISADTEVEINLSVGDAFYLTDSSRPFWT